MVRENIDSEARKADGFKRDMLRGHQVERKPHLGQQRKRKRHDEDNPAEDGAYADAEVAIDTELFGPLGMLAKHDPYHDADSLLAEMEIACDALEQEGEASQQDADAMLAIMQETVGNLSDLRYGKFARISGSEAGGGLEKSVVESLKALEYACASSSR